jgi:hypothetical protein
MHERIMLDPALRGRDRSAVMACSFGARDASTMPSDEILNDPGWQPFHAFRWICGFLGHPEPTSPPGFEMMVEVRHLTPEEAEEWQRLSSEDRQARMRETLVAKEVERMRRHFGDTPPS